jgi:GNAT superfamily N-acetyltransferase
MENTEQKVARLLAIYVSPLYQKMGVASKMREAFEAWAKDKDVCGYMINVSNGSDLSSSGYEAYEVSWFKRVVK